MEFITFLQIAVADTTQSSLQNKSDNGTYWLWIAIAEFVIIGFLLYKLSKPQKPSNLSDFEQNVLRTSKTQGVDMANLMDSIHRSPDLYKELSRKCHPDRFVNTDLQAIAEDLFQEISKNKRNFKELNILKQKAIKELNVKF